MKVKKCLRGHLLLLATVLSIVMGVTIGMLCRQLKPSAGTILIIGFPGELLMRMLKLLILPLIVASLITGIANLDGKSAGKMGVVTLAYYISNLTTVVALVVGLTLVLAIRPGVGNTMASTTQERLEQLHISRPWMPLWISSETSYLRTSCRQPFSKRERNMLTRGERA
ncbi:excitatory amino acid transporter-like [Haliotis rubra]|uniref:excitatory amino acid transporter-like n=1 Tax=Haliotis rubra TaxID=36100 RepID=UPI001EE5E88C|nr:excitatory amino acid transporter-like [Haliotis rubra]